MRGHLTLAADDRIRTPKTIRVLLADDRNARRRSLRGVLDGQSGVKVVAVASDLETTLDQLDKANPDVVVLDVQHADEPAMALIRRVKAHAPRTEIVVLAMQTSAVFARAAIAAGATGYVLKEHADQDLRTAVTATAAGQEFLSPDVAAGVQPPRRSASGAARRSSVTR